MRGKKPRVSRTKHCNIRQSMPCCVRTNLTPTVYYDIYICNYNNWIIQSQLLWLLFAGQKDDSQLLFTAEPRTCCAAAARLLSQTPTGFPVVFFSFFIYTDTVHAIISYQKKGLPFTALRLWTVTKRDMLWYFPVTTSVKHLVKIRLSIKQLSV